MNNNSGLSSKEVIISRSKYGSNILTKKKKNTFIKLVIESLGDPIVKILLMALAIKVIFLFKNSNSFETIGILMAIVFSCVISALSEYGSEKAFEKLNIENSSINVKVKRNNKKTIVKMEEIVVGDIIFLETGDKIPCDGIIIQKEIYVNESILTGESKEKLKKINDCVYKGTIVTSKDCVILATLVGDKTFYGKIANDIQSSTIESPLKERLKVLANDISKLGYLSALVILISYLFSAVVIPNNFNIINLINCVNLLEHLIYGLTLSVAVVVMAVPEGLPMMITLVLSSNMKRMIKKNVLVRKLVGIETAGSLNILFTDKTGTLTEGKLKVSHFMDADFNEYNSIEKIKLNTHLYNLVFQSLVYNNDAYITEESIVGSNTTDRTILEFVKSDNKDSYKILDKVPFDSAIKYSSVTTNYNTKTTFIKGAYEKIVDKCSMYLDKNNKTKLIDKNKYKYIIDKNTSEGKRVLALAYTDNNVMILLGFIFIKDNIRQNAYNGIKTIKDAGIIVVMVTGDAKDTGSSVARELNIIGRPSDIVMSSEEFNNMSDDEVKKILLNLKVLYRSLPKDKNRLVYLAQEMKLIVGMTGDGVNDAPALKKADVGFSMGSGTEMAKETSDIVILDDNINSIATSILYGRTIFKSIRKFIIFQLSVNVCAVLLSVIGPFIGVLTPVTVIQMLWINMVIDTFAGLAFAFEAPSIEYMKELPKKRNEKIINKYMKNQIVLNGIFSTIVCIWFLKSKTILNIYSSEEYLLTAFFGLFIFLAVFNAFNARTYRINIFSNLLKNKAFLIVFGFIVIIQILLIYYGGELFRTTGLSIYEFEIMILLSFSIIPFDFIRKLILKKTNMSRDI